MAGTLFPRRYDWCNTNMAMYASFKYQRKFMFIFKSVLLNYDEMTRSIFTQRYD